MNTRITTSSTDVVIGGVAGGIAEYLEVDSLIVRLVFVLLLISSFGTFLIIYILLMVLLPSAPSGSTAEPRSTTREQGSTIGTLEVSNARIRSRRQRSAGGLLLLLGIVLLANRFLNISLGDVLPLILIGLGLWLLAKRRPSWDSEASATGAPPSWSGGAPPSPGPRAATTNLTPDPDAPTTPSSAGDPPSNAPNPGPPAARSGIPPNAAAPSPPSSASSVPPSAPTGALREADPPSPTTGTLRDVDRPSAPTGALREADPPPPPTGALPSADPPRSWSPVPPPPVPDPAWSGDAEPHDEPPPPSDGEPAVRPPRTESE